MRPRPHSNVSSKNYNTSLAANTSLGCSAPPRNGRHGVIVSISHARSITQRAVRGEPYAMRAVISPRLRCSGSGSCSPFPETKGSSPPHAVPARRPALASESYGRHAVSISCVRHGSMDATDSGAGRERGCAGTALPTWRRHLSATANGTYNYVAYGGFDWTCRA